MVVLMLPAELSQVFFHFVAETTRTRKGEAKDTSSSSTDG